MNFYLRWQFELQARTPVMPESFVCLPQTEGLKAWWQDMCVRSALFCRAISRQSVECEMRFAIDPLPGLLHCDGMLTGGTAYRGPATAMIDSALLKGINQDSDRRYVNQQEWEGHLHYPGLYDFYAFDRQQEHGVPLTADPRATFFMRGAAAFITNPSNHLKNTGLQ